MLQREGDGEGRVAGEVDEWRREGEMATLDRGYGLAGYLGGRKVVCAGRQGGRRKWFKPQQGAGYGKDTCRMRARSAGRL